MTIEEKAKAYDDALKLARDYHEDMNCFKYLKGVLENIFPELAESEDERIRKEIYNALRYLETELSWDALGRVDILDAYAWLEKQGQKPTNKIDLFNVGDWIIFNENHNGIYQVEKIQGLRYYLKHYLGGTLSVHFDNELIRPWTIQDAKPGDVLATDKGGVFIYAKVLYNQPHAYCGVDKFGVFKDNCLENNWTTSVDKVHPATKEQRDFLFQKMKEAGYEWDSKKKELRKIEQKPKWTDEDKSKVEEIVYFLDTAKAHYASTTALDDCIDWIKSLKQRMEE